MKIYQTGLKYNLTNDRHSYWKSPGIFVHRLKLNYLAFTVSNWHSIFIEMKFHIEVTVISFWLFDILKFDWNNFMLLASCGHHRHYLWWHVFFNASRRTMHSKHHDEPFCIWLKYEHAYIEILKSINQIMLNYAGFFWTSKVNSSDFGSFIIQKAINLIKRI